MDAERNRDLLDEQADLLTTMGQLLNEQAEVLRAISRHTFPVYVLAWVHLGLSMIAAMVAAIWYAVHLIV